MQELTMRELPRPIDPGSMLPWENDASSALAALPEWPSLSVVMPIYQSGAFLERTLRSLILSGLDGVEVIVMDGGSTDETQMILEHYENFLSEWRSERDRGQSDAINKGFEQASGEILHWLNGDDILLPGSLTRVRRFFSEHPEVDVVSGNAVMTQADLSPIRRFRYSPDKLNYEYLINYASHHLVQPAVFFRRAAWAACGPTRLDLHYAMDAELFLKMARDFGIHHLDCEIAYSVYHEGCKTRRDRGPSIVELAMVQARLGAFEQAEATLRVLVELLESAEKGGDGSALAASSAEECPRCKAAEARANAIEIEAARNRELLLDLDWRETS
jgi:GT2 family glycosyltransferase